MFRVEVQARLTSGAVVPFSVTHEKREVAIRLALDSMPLGSVAIRTVVVPSLGSSPLAAAEPPEVGANVE
ncbi:hypothetical protein [Frondihabitans cladoniiphilus]|uniref:Uncharacterized protein n=1 Tax=Frondihabitans cladoniiphilus TaxID=715785 RepID=A0ABP8W6P6_9MICO